MNYSLDNKEKLRKRFLICLFSFVFCILALISLLVVTLCLANYKNYLYFETIGTILAAILVFLSIFLFSKTMDLRRYLLHFDSVLAENTRDLKAEVTSISERTRTLDDNIRVFEVTLEGDDASGVFYFLSIFPLDALQQGKCYRFILADRFIREIEDEI